MKKIIVVVASVIVLALLFVGIDTVFGSAWAQGGADLTPYIYAMKGASAVIIAAIDMVILGTKNWQKKK